MIKRLEVSSCVDCQETVDDDQLAFFKWDSSFVGRNEERWKADETGQTSWSYDREAVQPGEAV